MTFAKKIKSIALLSVLLYAQTNAYTQFKQSYNPDIDFYTTTDFESVKKIDAHVHIRTLDTSFVHQAKKDNFRVLSIVVDEDPGIQVQQKDAIYQKQLFPDEVSFATTFSVKNFNDPKWKKEVISDLKKSFSEGAIAVKIYKNIGMDLKDKAGNFVMIDNPKFDPVLDFLTKHHIPVIGHLGEPWNCWLPMNQMTMNHDKRYYSKHPEFYMYLHPECPSYEDQINARDSMLEKHPDLRFIGAHLGSLEWNTDELAKRLDRFPNMAVDMAARIPNLQYLAMKDWQKVHDFFMKYQDRLLYGTDRIADGTQKAAEAEELAHSAWLRDWQFFCTNDKMNSSNFEGDFKGLKLPKEVINKIYRLNAEKWFPPLRKK
ncbi:MAG: amidohydrolase family protein [Bacteroidota bacterium]|nr:amidohydrolase family protein [Bacteroidota bacterium]